MKSLTELYQHHSGKVSDKWSLYLVEYDRLFAGYRQQAVSLLEIGVQNGGSLELWASYFASAKTLVGCDINEDCSRLVYEDPRIALVIGDANEDQTQVRVLAHANEFDVIIDDGSHTSRDIIETFARYFPVLREGGIFVAEDLHCSYWAEFDGGLYAPFSSLAFFKRLADVVNHEHWGTNKSRTALMSGFSEQYGVRFVEEQLAHVHSVEFINSMCVIHKKAIAENILGTRHIAGDIEAVVSGPKAEDGRPIEAPLQYANDWAVLECAPEEQWASLRDRLHLIEAEAKVLRHENLRLTDDVSALARELERTVTTLADVAAQKEHAEHIIREMTNSSSWRLTAPARSVGSYWRPAKTGFAVATQLVQRHGIAGVAKKALDVVGREGISGIRSRIAEDLRVGSSHQYTQWIQHYDTVTDSVRQALSVKVSQMSQPPLISVVMPTYNPNREWLAIAVDSLRHQIYPHWELCIVDDASSDPSVRPLLKTMADSDNRIKIILRDTNGHISLASNSGLAAASGDWVALLDHDDQLAEHALYCVAEAIALDPAVQMIYSDEDKIDEGGIRHSPYFKPDWNVDLFYSQNLFSHLGVYRRSLLVEVGGFREGFEGSQDYDLALRCVERVSNEHIQHIPRVLYHWRVHKESTAGGVAAKPYAVTAAQRALQEHFDRTHVAATVEPSAAGYHVTYPIPGAAPLVSIIIIANSDLPALKRTIGTLVKHTLYADYELIVVTQSESTALQVPSFGLGRTVGIVRAESDAGYGAMVNQAVRLAKGSLIALLGVGVEVISPGWLAEMVSHALRPDVGAVGARLNTPDGLTCHGGLIMGFGGVAGMAHKGLAARRLGYFGRAQLVSNYSAVLGACLVTRKAQYLADGGLDEQMLTAHYAAIDLCLRFREAGRRNVWLPAAELQIPYKDCARASEGVSQDAAEEHYMRSRWASVIAADPAYSPNLSLSGHSFALAWPPRVEPLG